MFVKSKFDEHNFEKKVLGVARNSGHDEQDVKTELHSYANEMTGNSITSMLLLRILSLTRTCMFHELPV